MPPSGGHARDLAEERQLDQGIDWPVKPLIQLDAEEGDRLDIFTWQLWDCHLESLGNFHMAALGLSSWAHLVLRLRQACLRWRGERWAGNKYATSWD